MNHTALRLQAIEQKDKRSAKKSRLETIEGIGAKKRQALLQYLGGLQEVIKADIATLEKVPGISKVLAENIYDALPISTY